MEVALRGTVAPRRRIGRSTRYSPEVREGAVRMYTEHQDEYSSAWAVKTSIVGKLG